VSGQFGRADQGIFSFWIHSLREKWPLKYIGFDGRGSQSRDCFQPRDFLTFFEKQIQGSKPSDLGDGVNVRICSFSGGIKNSISLTQLSNWCRARFGLHDIGSGPQPRPYDLAWVILDSTRAANL